MLKRIGKFEFYVSELEALDILKAIFLHVDISKEYSGNPTRYHRFFQRMKHEVPDLFEDVSVDEDKFLPYSEEIEEAFSLAQDYQIISRPNPDIYPFRIKASKERLEQDIKGKFSKPQLKAIGKVAAEFEKELREGA